MRSLANNETVNIGAGIDSKKMLAEFIAGYNECSRITPEVVELAKIFKCNPEALAKLAGFGAGAFKAALVVLEG
jgi:hypothetical protein